MRKTYETSRYAEVAKGRLHCVDFGGEDWAVLLLHGLCGRGTEWRATAAALLESHRVLALDQRGHGKSVKHPEDLSRSALVNDAIKVILELANQPVVIIGQSMGGNVAYHVASKHPELVRALVVVETQDWGCGASGESVSRWLRGWPIPFASRDAALQWFETQGLVAEAWSEGLEKRDDGWHPDFCIEDMLRTAEQPASDHLTWESISIPTLVVAGQISTMTDGRILRKMAETPPDGCYSEISGAGHDVHLERTNTWISVLTDLLRAHL